MNRDLRPDDEYRGAIAAEVRKLLGGNARQALIRNESVWYAGRAWDREPADVARDVARGFVRRCEACGCEVCVCHAGGAL